MNKNKTNQREPFSKEDGASNTDCIKSFFQCAMCVKEMPSDQSPKEWARFNVGWTNSGMQVWCTRHEVNVTHIDFMDNSLPGDTTRALAIKLIAKPKVGSHD